MIHILVVDHYESVGKGTKLLLEKEGDFQVTFLCSSEEALAVIAKQTFDVLLFDLDMSVIREQELVKKVAEIDPEMKIIIYSGHDVESFFHTFIELGVSGFVSKTASKEQLVAAIRSVLRGDAVMPVEFLEQLKRITKHSGLEQSSQITKEDIELLEQVALGRTNKEIADILFLSQRAIEYRLTNVFKKLAVGSRMEAVEKVREMGLIGEVNYFLREK